MELRYYSLLDLTVKKPGEWGEHLTYLLYLHGSRKDVILKILLKSEFLTKNFLKIGF